MALSWGAPPVPRDPGYVVTYREDPPVEAGDEVEQQAGDVGSDDQP